jgi:porin
MRHSNTLIAALAACALLAPPVRAQDTAPGFWDRPTLTGDWGGLRTRLEDAGIKLAFQEQSELFANTSGGIRRGTVYDGLTSGSVSLDLDKLAGWSGATLFASFYQIHGRGPTANLVGNLQVVSSLEATRSTKLYQAYLEQSFLDGTLLIRLGQEGANDQFMVTQYGAAFMNSSFGFPALAALDLPSGAPNYPLAAPFVRAQWQPTDELTLSAALFSGDPAPSGTGDPQLRNASGTAFRLNDHALAITEAAWARNQADDDTGLPGTYKIGAWYHSGRFNDQLFDTTGRSLADPASNGRARSHASGYALYAVVDQMLWQKPGSKTQGLGAFLLVNGAPAGFNLVNLFVAGGLNWKGPFEGRDNDVIALGFAYLNISPAARRYGADLARYTNTGSGYRSNETVLEATWTLQMTPWAALQPDLQYVINPGAGLPNSYTTKPLQNAVTAALRLTVTL